MPFPGCQPEEEMQGTPSDYPVRGKIIHTDTPIHMASISEQYNVKESLFTDVDAARELLDARSSE